jgi:hypothetical protein
MNESESVLVEVRRCAQALVLCFSVTAVQSSHAAAGSCDDDLLETIKQASVASSEFLRSAVGSGTFEQYVQEPGDKEPKLRTKARVNVFFARGKYHLRFDYETMLVRTVYTDMQGNKTDEKLAEWKPDRLFLIDDGLSATVVRFSERIRPRGCEAEIFSERPAPSTGFPWGDPARLGKESMDVERLIQNLGKNSIQVSDLPDGGHRGIFRPKNSDKVRVEFDTKPEIGFNVVAIRAFNEGDEIPVTATELTWKKSGDVWYVEQINKLQDYRRVKEPGPLTRTVFKYDKMDLNVEVDPRLFGLDSTELPKGTRFLDRRRDAPHPILYYDGSALTEQRE